MASIRLKNSLFIILTTLITIILVVYFLDKIQKKDVNDSVSIKCDNQELFRIPLVYIKNIAIKDTADIMVNVRRNGKNLSDILTFAVYDKKGDSLNLMLRPNIKHTEIALIKDEKKRDFQVQMLMDVKSIPKQDSIIVSIRNTDYVIHKFGTQSFIGEHGYLMCTEFYEMNGKIYGMRSGNTLNGQRTAN